MGRRPYNVWYVTELFQTSSFKTEIVQMLTKLLFQSSIWFGLVSIMRDKHR